MSNTERASELTRESWAMRTIPTPSGRFWLIVRGDRLWGAELEPRWPQLSHRLLARHGVDAPPGQVRRRDDPTLAGAEEALEKYFSGDLRAPAMVDVDLDGTALQRKVWATLRGLEPGETITYRELARRVRRRGAFRAVGAANGANPCAIFVPCHRVVGSSGALQGYGAGIEVKASLLRHEGVKNDGWRLED